MPKKRLSWSNVDASNCSLPRKCHRNNATPTRYTHHWLPRSLASFSTPPKGSTYLFEVKNVNNIPMSHPKVTFTLVNSNNRILIKRIFELRNVKSSRIARYEFSTPRGHSHASSLELKVNFQCVTFVSGWVKVGVSKCWMRIAKKIWKMFKLF